MTGGRVKRIKPYTGNETFMMTYGDGVGDIPIDKLVEAHKNKGKIATVTAVQPSGRFGAMELNEESIVDQFQEKPKGDGAWINGGFFVFEPGIYDYISGDNTILEREPLENLSKDSQLAAYKHFGYWKPMDTLRDKNELENAWSGNKAQWKIWNKS
jgi:glucose-1-phosphate cytidylyltransferase